MQKKNETRQKSHILQIIDSKCIKDLNIKGKNIKLLDNNREKSSYLGFGYDCLNTTIYEAQSMKKIS